MGEIFLFSVIILLILIYFIDKKKYIYCLMFFYLILPDYCAISLGTMLPTLTASRCLLILLLITTIVSQKGKISLKAIIDAKISGALMFFIMTETIVFLAHINISEHIKEYFGFVLEIVMFLILYTNNIKNSEENENMIKTMATLATIVSIFSILETITGINFAEFLDTKVNSGIISVNYTRLNLRRATFSLGHPISLAVYMGMLVPIVMYCIKKYKDKKYTYILILSIITIILTISRGPIFIVFLFLTIIFINMNKQEKNRYAKLIIITIIITILLCLLSDKVYNTLAGTFGAVFKELGFAIEISDDFGANENGTASRFEQWTALPNVLRKNLFCGGGQSYIMRENVSYKRADGRISNLYSLDCEYLAVLINKGIIGFLGLVIFYMTIFKRLLVKNKSSKLIKYLLYSFTIALTCYLSVCQLTTNKMFWTIIALIIVEKSNINRKEFDRK